jgi:hypothetical protein
VSRDAADDPGTAGLPRLLTALSTAVLPTVRQQDSAIPLIELSISEDCDVQVVPSLQAPTRTFKSLLPMLQVSAHAQLDMAAERSPET